MIFGCSQIESKASIEQQRIERVSKAAEYDIIPAADRTAAYLPRLKDKSVGLVVNHTSMIGNIHLIDTLLSLDVDIKAIFAPEHGLDGLADAGEQIDDGRYRDVPIYSLYGADKQPSADQLGGIDILVFDIQDVGARFYTYISTLHYVMAAAAEYQIPLLVLDRPNPNGFYVDGPVLEPEYRSFVGMHPVPVVYGMTIGEYAQMINGENWLADGMQCDLEVILCKNYDHTMTYDLPVKPSPNLPNLKSILLYPSLCFFEGTTVSIGRGTDRQFQVIGHPALDTVGAFGFTPISGPGAKHPKHENVTCFGESIDMPVGQLMKHASLQLNFLIQYHQKLKAKAQPFFNENNFFEKLAGTNKLRSQLSQGLSADDIRASWQTDLVAFKQIRAKYLLYPDF